MLAAIAVTIAACIPGVFQLVSLSRRAAALSFGTLPVISVDSLWQLPAACLAWSIGVIQVTVPVVAVVSCGVGVILAVIWGGRVRLGDAVRANVIVMMLYVLIPPILFLIVSFLSPSMLLVSRYWSWSLVPLAVLLALVLGSIQGQGARRIAVVTTLVFVILRVSSQERVLEEWREAAALARTSGKRVILFSGLIEAEGPPQIEEGEYYQYLRAPLLVYGVEQPIDVVGVTYSEEQLEDAFEVAPFTLVAFHARRSGVLSPERFLRTIQRQGREPLIQKQDRLITVANVR